MGDLKIKSSQDIYHILIHMLLAFGSTAYLFYLDEGKHTFNWMNSIGNWIAFLFYFGFFLLIQWAVKSTLIKTYSGLTVTLISGLLSCIVLVLALIILFIQ